MRNQKDAYFSELYDRIGHGWITKKKWRVQPCPLENHNKSYMSGEVLIIVDTNRKRNIVNQQKLKDLLPYEREYVCNSLDRVINLPSKNEIQETSNRNPGMTGNLES